MMGKKMFKLIGAGMVLISATFVGFYMSRQYVNRPRQLRQLMHALQQLETEIHYGLTPLPEALERISRYGTDPINCLLLTASQQMTLPQTSTEEAWRYAVEACWDQNALQSTEQEIILQLGRSLGSSDSKEQVKHLQLAMNQLATESAIAVEEQQKYARMWKSLGVLTGALIVTLMY